MKDPRKLLLVRKQLVVNKMLQRVCVSCSLTQTHLLSICGIFGLFWDLIYFYF